MVKVRGGLRQRVGVLLRRPQAAAHCQYVPVILRQPFVDPQHFALHRRLGVRCCQPDRATVLAIPRMDVLMREHTKREPALRLINQCAFGNAAVVGLVVFQAEVCHVVAECEQKVVVFVVLAAEKRLRLLDELAHGIGELWGRLESGGTFGGDVHVDRRLRSRERKATEVLGR
jgi:hypothetical protein